MTLAVLLMTMGFFANSSNARNYIEHLSDNVVKKMLKKLDNKDVEKSFPKELIGGFCRVTLQQKSHA